MGRQFLLELIPYRGTRRLYLFSLSTAALLFFPHQINKSIQHSRVAVQDWDGRYSRRNKEWAKTIPNDNPETVRCGYALNSHPAVLDGFIDLVREEQQRSRTQREKLEPSRPSVRDKLKQELPAHKSAAPKKREPER